MWWGRNRRQRAAISQAEIAKKCNLLGCFAAGFRAYRRAADGDTFPCPYERGSKEARAWWKGCIHAAEKAREHERFPEPTLRRIVAPRSTEKERTEDEKDPT